jgi:predicted metalloprotease with PDZ domain
VYVHVPRWLAVLIGVVLIAGAGFGIGWAVAPGDDHEGDRRDRIVTVPRAPQQPGNQPNGRGLVPSPRIPNQLPAGAFLGVSVRAAANGGSGAEIVNVASGSPADQAGLRAGDVITKVDGATVASSADLSSRISAHQPGDDVSITYVRNGDTKTVSVHLSNRFAARSGASVAPA